MSESTREPAGEPAREPAGEPAREPAGTPADRLQPADWQTPPESLPAFMIIGRTRAGKTFRPSDWAERLCGVMAGFGGNARMGYSPHVHPVDAGGVKCVVVHRRIKAIEPMAWDFLLGFARDNELQLAPMPQEDQ